MSLCVQNDISVHYFLKSTDWKRSGAHGTQPDLRGEEGGRKGSGPGGEVCPAEANSGGAEGADSTLHDVLRVACRDSLHIRHHRPGRPKHQLVGATTQPPPTFLTHPLSLSSSFYCLICASTAIAKPQGLRSTN